MNTFLVLKNKTIYNSKAAAVQSLNNAASQVEDGSPVIARYQNGNNVIAVLGIKNTSINGIPKVTIVGTTDVGSSDITINQITSNSGTAYQIIQNDEVVGTINVPDGTVKGVTVNNNNIVDSNDGIAKVKIKTINNTSIIGEGNINIDNNVQSDWNTSDLNDGSFIKNKPTIPNESTIEGWGFVKGVKMNDGIPITPYDGVIDLGTVVTTNPNNSTITLKCGEWSDTFTMNQSTPKTINIPGGKSNYETYYETAIELGEVPLTPAEWLATLKGDPGKSAYEVYVDSVGEGITPMTEEQWLNSLIGPSGNGYEYIYKGFSSEVLDWSSNGPNTWTSNAGYQSDNYVGPSGSEWSNTPIDLDDTDNKYEYISIRKKTAGAWGAFSTPSLLAQYVPPGTSGQNGSYKQYIYKNNADSPGTPSSASYPPSGWSTTPTTPDAGNYTWCSERTVSFTSGNVTQYSLWSTPYRLTGEQGQQGETGEQGPQGIEGKYIEQIYKSFPTELTFTSNDDNPANWAANQTPGYAGPSGHQWNSAPQTVTDTYVYEYISQRKFDGTSFGQFTTPVLWAKFGKDGLEGRGIATITKKYLATSERTGITTSSVGWNTTVPNLDTSNPYLWTYDDILYTDNTHSYSTPYITGVHSTPNESIHDITINNSIPTGVEDGVVNINLSSYATTGDLQNISESYRAPVLDPATDSRCPEWRDPEHSHYNDQTGEWTYDVGYEPAVANGIDYYEWPVRCFNGTVSIAKNQIHSTGAENINVFAPSEKVNLENYPGLKNGDIVSGFVNRSDGKTIVTTDSVKWNTTTKEFLLYYNNNYYNIWGKTTRNYSVECFNPEKYTLNKSIEKNKFEIEQLVLDFSGGSIEWQGYFTYEDVTDINSDEIIYTSVFIPNSDCVFNDLTVSGSTKTGETYIVPMLQGTYFKTVVKTVIKNGESVSESHPIYKYPNEDNRNDKVNIETTMTNDYNAINRCIQRNNGNLTLLHEKIYFYKGTFGAVERNNLFESKTNFTIEGNNSTLFAVCNDKGTLIPTHTSGTGGNLHYSVFRFRYSKNATVRNLKIKSIRNNYGEAPHNHYRFSSSCSKLVAFTILNQDNDSTPNNPLQLFENITFENVEFKGMYQDFAIEGRSIESSNVLVKNWKSREVTMNSPRSTFEVHNADLVQNGFCGDGMHLFYAGARDFKMYNSRLKQGAPFTSVLWTNHQGTNYEGNTIHAYNCVMEGNKLLDGGAKRFYHYFTNCTFKLTWFFSINEDWNKTYGGLIRPAVLTDSNGNMIFQATDVDLELQNCKVIINGNRLATTTSTPAPHPQRIKICNCDIKGINTGDLYMITGFSGSSVAENNIIDWNSKNYGITINTENVVSEAANQTEVISNTLFGEREKIEEYDYTVNSQSNLPTNASIGSTAQVTSTGKGYEVILSGEKCKYVLIILPLSSANESNTFTNKQVTINITSTESVTFTLNGTYTSRTELAQAILTALVNEGYNASNYKNNTYDMLYLESKNPGKLLYPNFTTSNPGGYGNTAGVLITSLVDDTPPGTEYANTDTKPLGIYSAKGGSSPSYVLGKECTWEEINFGLASSVDTLSEKIEDDSNRIDTLNGRVGDILGFDYNNCGLLEERTMYFSTVGTVFFAINENKYYRCTNGGVGCVVEFSVLGGSAHYVSGTPIKGILKLVEQVGSDRKVLFKISINNDSYTDNSNNELSTIIYNALVSSGFNEGLVSNDSTTKGIVQRYGGNIQLVTKCGINLLDYSNLKFEFIPADGATDGFVRSSNEITALNINRNSVMFSPGEEATWIEVAHESTPLLDNIRNLKTITATLSNIPAPDIAVSGDKYWNGSEWKYFNGENWLAPEAYNDWVIYNQEHSGGAVPGA